MKRRHHRLRMEIVQTHEPADDIGQRVGNGGLGCVGDVRRAVGLVAVDFRPERPGNLPAVPLNATQFRPRPDSFTVSPSDWSQATTLE